MESCAKHPHEISSAICRRCGGAWCRDCLVYSFGPKKPPYCMSCAMVAGGVRSAFARPAMTKRDVRARAKAGTLNLSRTIWGLRSNQQAGKERARRMN